MTNDPQLLGMEMLMLSRGWDRETILVATDDDFEAHGMGGVAGLVASIAIVAGSAGGTLLATAGNTLAPEPVSLTGSLSGTSTYASSYYLNTGTTTWAYQVPGTWFPNTSLPAGAPCATYAAGYGATLTSTIQAYGSYRRCY